MHNTANETSRTFMDASSKDDQEEEVAPSRQIDISSPRQFGSSGSTTGSDTNSASSTRKRRRSLSSGGGETGSTLQERWDEMFERLRKYKEEHGSCNVPNRYDKTRIGCTGYYIFCALYQLYPHRRRKGALQYCTIILPHRL